MIILTAILSITATYAWFSTQRDVEILGMRLNVEVAESMQISLDGEKWVQSINIADMRQFYGTQTDATAIDAKTVGTGSGNTNYVPTELLPVSSSGDVENGKLIFKTGTVGLNASTGKTELTNVTKCSESDLTEAKTVAQRETGNASHPYLVFDMYLRNVSARTSGLDSLILDEGSNVWVNTDSTSSDQEGVGVAGTGLEYSARVGFVVYDNTVPITAEGDQGALARALTASSVYRAAIWEPNHLSVGLYLRSSWKWFSIYFC